MSESRLPVPWCKGHRSLPNISTDLGPFRRENGSVKFFSLHLFPRNLKSSSTKSFTYREDPFILCQILESNKVGHERIRALAQIHNYAKEKHGLHEGYAVREMIGPLPRDEAVDI